MELKKINKFSRSLSQIISVTKNNIRAERGRKFR